MCNYCDPQGWLKKCCNFCGTGTGVYISISIALPNADDYPYSTTDLCESCFREHGINAAIDHNEMVKSDLA